MQMLRRDEEVLDNLVTHAICTDFALRSMIGEAELLIFTSVQLPQNCHSESMIICLQGIMPFSHEFGSLEFAGLQEKPYFWGVFRGQQGSISPQSDYMHGHTLSPNSGYPKSFNLKGCPGTFPSKNSPCKSIRKELRNIS